MCRYRCMLHAKTAGSATLPVILQIVNNHSFVGVQFIGSCARSALLLIRCLARAASPESDVTKVIFDTDPGIDDAMALLFLKRAPGVEIVGVTSSFGNGTIETTTRNLLYLCQV